jgi:hypothetical protein
MLLFRHTERRAFIRLFGGAAVAGLIVWPLAAQQSEMPLVGFLNSTSADTWRDLAQAFRDGMSGTGYIEGQNVSVEYRWAEGEIDRLPGLAAALVQRRVVVIVTSGGDIGTGSQRSDVLGSDRLHLCRRSSQVWLRREPQSARREYHGGDIIRI